MTLILSLSFTGEGLWASGHDGLFRLMNGELVIVPQPQTQLYCSAAIGETLLAGGLPHGLALSNNSGQNWYPTDIDNVRDAVLCVAADPNFAHSGVLLAGTAGSGILRSHNRGWNWKLCNYGLESFSVFHIAWAPPAPAQSWPAWEIVFAAAEDGLYRSPNGGLGWRHCEGAEGVMLTVAAARDFHRTGVVLAGAEETGLWRSTDGGRRFDAVSAAPDQINALVETASGWLLSSQDSLWSSADGMHWAPIANSTAALVMLDTPDGLYLGTEEGVERLDIEALLKPSDRAEQARKRPVS